MYLRLTDILALAADYTPSTHETKVFFQTMQNKMHFAVTGKTAPELIAQCANSQEPNMGLTSWKGDVVRKADIMVAKNYLSETEIDELNRIVVMFLDYADDQARRRKQIFLGDWQSKLDEFLRFNERDVLPDSGSISREDADIKAEQEYELFNRRRREAVEAEAENEAVKQLEEIAKSLPVGNDEE